MSLPGDARANLTVSPQSWHDLAVKFVQGVSTSATRFFATEPLLVLVSPKPFWGLAKAFWVASLIVHPEL